MDYKYIQEQFKKIDISISDEQSIQFDTFYERMIEVNQVMNLTGITDFKEVVQKHFIDSVYGLKPYIKPNCKILDVGTGAGFPGVPLKILYPDTSMTLLDSLQKRLRYLDEVISILSLKDISTLHGRAEDYGKDPSYREQYDLVVSRAVANLSTLSEYCLPYVRVNGYFISYKSGNVNQELEESKNAIAILGGEIENVVKFNLPDSDISRSLIVIHKVRNTSKKYPRKAGLPAKEPLK